MSPLKLKRIRKHKPFEPRGRLHEKNIAHIEEKFHKYVFRDKPFEVPIEQKRLTEYVNPNGN